MGVDEEEDAEENMEKDEETYKKDDNTRKGRFGYSRVGIVGDEHTVFGS